MAFDKIEKLMDNYICNNCLGRQYSRFSRGLTNYERGKILRIIIDNRKAILKNKKPRKCYVCNGLFDNLDKWTEKAKTKLKKIEFNSLLVGTKLSNNLAEKEEKLWEKIGIENTEPLKAELNREIGKRLEAYFKKSAEFKNPDILIILNLEKNKVELEINPLYIFGYYKKLQRGFPQCKWGTPGHYKTSIQEIIAKPVMRLTKGKDNKFHGAGREDIDARCLGWRPFVVEILKPVKRRIDLKRIIKEINKTKKVNVKGLKYSDMITVRRIKDFKGDKAYRLLVKFENPIKKERLKDLKRLVGMIQQRTPQRVAHRRADLIRRREVKEMNYRLINKKTLELKIKGTAGLYVKELVSGDKGRTKPSVSEILGIEARPVELDVIKIEKFK